MKGTRDPGCACYWLHQSASSSRTSCSHKCLPHLLHACPHSEKINTTKLSPSATDRNCILSAHGVQVKVGSASLQRVSWKGQQGSGAVSNTVPGDRHPLNGGVDPTCHLWGLHPSPCRVGLRHWGVQSQCSSCRHGR